MIGKFIASFLANFLTLFILDWFMPNVSLGYPTGFDHFTWSTFSAALPSLLILALILTLLLQLVKPLLKLIFLPINFLTLGLFDTVIYIAIIWLAIYLVPTFTVSALTIFGFNLGELGTILSFAFIYSLVQSIILSILK